GGVGGGGNGGAGVEWVRGAPPLPRRAARGPECARACHLRHPRLGFGPRLRLGQPPPRGREGYRVHGGDRGAAVLGPLGQVRNASSLTGAAFRGRRGDGPARQLLHRADPAEGHPAHPLRRGDGGVPTAVRRSRRGATADADVAPADPHRGRARRRGCDRGRLRGLAGDEQCAQAVRKGRARWDPRRRRESRLRPRFASADRGDGRGGPLPPGRFAGRDRAGHRRLDGGVGLRGHAGLLLTRRNQMDIKSVHSAQLPKKMEEYDLVVLGSGTGAKIAAWTTAERGERVALIERKYIGGSCHNIACLPSKNIIHSAKVASYVRRSKEFGIIIDHFRIDMSAVRERKRRMVSHSVDLHLDIFKKSGVELILGSGRFIGPRTLEVRQLDGISRRVYGEKVIISTGTHATIEGIPGLAESQPLTHIEALELDVIPGHLIVIGGGYVGLELSQAMRRFGSDVSIIERNKRVLHRE